jgi:sugar-specific transcriptional regulator TrmB
LELHSSKLQILVDLGLTLKQARVYTALVTSGPSKVSAISNISKVARPDVYKALSKLQQLGLVEKIIETPLEFEATSMNEALSLLLKIKTEQYEKVRAETRMLLDTVKIETPSSINQLEGPQFVLIPKGRYIGRINTAIAQAQTSLDFLLSWKRFSSGIISTFAESMERAWAKNVKTRFIIEKPLKSKTGKQLIQFYTKKAFCQIKIIPYRPAMVLGIYDKKEVFIIVDPKADLPGSPALWSNNPSLIALTEDYFETLWLTAIESNFKIPRKPKK